MNKITVVSLKSLFLVILFGFLGCVAWNFWYDFCDFLDESYRDKLSAEDIMQLRLRDKILCQHPELFSRLEQIDLVDCTKARRLLNENVVLMSAKKAFANLLEKIMPMLTFAMYLGVSILIIVTFTMCVLLFFYIKKNFERSEHNSFYNMFNTDEKMYNKEYTNEKTSKIQIMSE